MDKDIKRITLNLSRQYPEGSINAQRYEALKEYYGPNLKKMMEQALWVVLGPIGSALAGMPENEVKRQLGSSKGTFTALQYEAENLLNPNSTGMPAPQIQPSEPEGDTDLGDGLDDLLS